MSDNPKLKQAIRQTEEIYHEIFVVARRIALRAFPEGPSDDAIHSIAMRLLNDLDQMSNMIVRAPEHESDLSISSDLNLLSELRAANKELA